MIENQSSEDVYIESNDSIDRKKKKRKHDKSSDSVHQKNKDVFSDSLNSFLVNMFSDGSTDDYSVRNKKKKKKHPEIELLHSDEDTERLETWEDEAQNSKMGPNEGETLTNSTEGFVRNNMTEFYQEDSIVAIENNHSFDIENPETYKESSKKNSFNDEKQMQEFTPKKSKKIKLEMKTPETELNRKGSESAGEDSVFKNKDKQKRKCSTETYNGDDQCEISSFFENATPKKPKKIKLEMKTPEAELNHKHNKRHIENEDKASISELQPEYELKEKKDKSDGRNRHSSISSTSEKISNSEDGIPTKMKKKNKVELPEVLSQEEEYDIPQIKKKKKKKDKDKSDERSRCTSLSSTSENTCSNSEDGIPSKKKKKIHKDEESVIPSQEEVYDVPQIKKKKKKKDKEKIYNSLPIKKIKMKETDRLLEDSYMSSDYSIINENLDSPAVQNTQRKKEYINEQQLNDPHKKSQEISSDLYHINAEEQRESSHEVARSESVSSPDTFTIEVQEDKGSTLNGSFSPNDKEKRPTTSVDKGLKKEILDEPVEEAEDYDSLIVDRLDESEKKSTLEDEEKNKLGRLYIVITWTVPELHLIETCVSTRPKRKQKAQIDSLGVEVKNGNYTKQEDEIIRRNFKEFCKEYDFPEDPTPFLNFVHGGEVLLSRLERVKFARYLARDLNDRLLSSVYLRFRRLFRTSDLKTGRFSAEEDKIIMYYMATKKKTQTPFADLGKILKRDNLAVEKRFKTLITPPPSEEIQWTQDRIEELLKVLVNVTGCGSIEELKNWDITPEDWAQVSLYFKLPAQKLRISWLYSIYPKVFTPKTTTKDEIKMRLVNLLRDNKETDWRAVNWDEIAQNFEGFTGASLNKLLKNTVTAHVPQKKQSDLGKCLKYLSKTKTLRKKTKKA